MNSVSWV